MIRDVVRASISPLQAAAPKKSIRLFCLLILAVASAAWLGRPNTAATQNPAAAYWSYAASGRLKIAIPSDVDGDSVDEILVVDENGQAALLGGDGQERWSYVSDLPVLAAVTVNFDGGADPAEEIVLAADNQLIVLTADGEVRWETPIARSTAAQARLLGIEQEQIGDQTLPPIRPVAVAAYDHERDGIDELLVLLQSGHLLAYNGSGRQIWSLGLQEDGSENEDPRLIVEDLDRDGAPEIVLSLFTPRRFSRLYYIDDGRVVWQESISRRITTLAPVSFVDGQSRIAVGTNFGQINLYDLNGELEWFRTVNKPITAMTPVELPGRQLLAVGTEAGSVITFTEEGKRFWTSHLASGADRRILSLLPTDRRGAIGQPALAAIVQPSGGGELADVLLLGANGQTLLTLADTDLPQITRLLDVNHDSYQELLLGRFATLQLIGLGVGDSEYIQEWEYGIDAPPTAVLVVDLDQDGEEEIIIGTEDGRLHGLTGSRSIRWLHVPGEMITHLAALRVASDTSPRLVVVRRQRNPDPLAAEGEPLKSWLEVREAKGERLWEVELPSEATAILVDDFNPDGRAELVVGTIDGRVMTFDAGGNLLWTHVFETLEGGVRQLLLLDGDAERPELLLVGGEREIMAFAGVRPLLAYPFATFSQPIQSFYAVAQPGGDELSLRLVVFEGNGDVHGLNWRGIEMSQWPWPQRIDGRPVVTRSADGGAVEAFQENATAFLVGADRGNVRLLTIENNQPETVWEIKDVSGVEVLFWDDLDKDGRPDTGLMGTRDGRLFLYENLHLSAPRRVLEVDLASAVKYVTLLRRAAGLSPDLLAVTENGRVRLFREQENRPPLLTDPSLEAERGQHTLSVQVRDVENDAVSVRLEVLEPGSGNWIEAGEQRLETGQGPLFWTAVTSPKGSERLRYRYRFDDGFYRGYVTPPPGPIQPLASPSAGSMRFVLGSLMAFALLGVAVYARQSQSPGAQARRFYRRLRQNRAATLTLLEAEYEALKGSPDFLLQLANQARRAQDSQIANLADGLFLLGNRPPAALSIITRTLDESAEQAPAWEGAQLRRHLYKTCQALLEAPTITELSLLRPQLVQLLGELEAQVNWSPILDALLPILTNLRDSERVEQVEDRLVYLNQAATRLSQLQEQLPEYSPTIERTLVRAIGRRWAGLVSAEIEEQRGRAELNVSLRTKRLAPNGRTYVAMDVRNSGRAPAENIVAVLEEMPAYHVHSRPQTIPFLPSGRSRQIRFEVEPRVQDRFRVALTLTYDDRNRHDKRLAFGDMVNLLPPVREFTPIANPYLPGTPLRRESPLFFGREELFEFIAEVGGNRRQRNVLILVGQRRTGKTSALLQLDEHLPPDIVPIYIDCQSLGVTPGMPALLQELSWQIADTLQSRGIHCAVPDRNAWQDDPTRLFQREFLPQVRSLLPPDTMLLLVFDEFEAFEAMVNDGILPRTLFTYLRHLMQHSEALSFIFVGTRRLEEMSADYWSVLFNIAVYKKIDYLSEAAAMRLICEPVAPYIVYDDLALDKILRVTAGHPYFLQLVCYTLVKRANTQQNGYITISDVNAALDEMLRLGEVHFAYLWQRSTFAERALLTAAAHLSDRNAPLHPEELIRYLESYNIELDPAVVTAGLNSLVERDIMREVTEEASALYELRIGLVGLWVAQNKSLSKLYAQQEN